MTEQLPAEVGVAIQAFRDHERARLLADKKERDLSLSVMHMAVALPMEQRNAYFTETEQILSEYDEKRRKAGLT